jgi:hypothetical protein
VCSRRSITCVCDYKDVQMWGCESNIEKMTAHVHWNVLHMVLACAKTYQAWSVCTGGAIELHDLQSTVLTWPQWAIAQESHCDQCPVVDATTTLQSTECLSCKAARDQTDATNYNPSMRLRSPIHKCKLMSGDFQM